MQDLSLVNCQVSKPPIQIHHQHHQLKRLTTFQPAIPSPIQLHCQLLQWQETLWLLSLPGQSIQWQCSPQLCPQTATLTSALAACMATEIGSLEASTPTGPPTARLQPRPAAIRLRTLCRQTAPLSSPQCCKSSRTSCRSTSAACQSWAAAVSLAARRTAGKPPAADLMCSSQVKSLLAATQKVRCSLELQQGLGIHSKQPCFHQQTLLTYLAKSSLVFSLVLSSSMPMRKFSRIQRLGSNSRQQVCCMTVNGSLSQHSSREYQGSPAQFQRFLQ